MMLKNTYKISSSSASLLLCFVRYILFFSHGKKNSKKLLEARHPTSVASRQPRGGFSQARLYKSARRGRHAMRIKKAAHTRFSEGEGRNESYDRGDAHRQDARPTTLKLNDVTPCVRVCVSWLAPQTTRGHSLALSRFCYARTPDNPRLARVNDAMTTAVT